MFYIFLDIDEHSTHTEEYLMNELNYGAIHAAHSTGSEAISTRLGGWAKETIENKREGQTSSRTQHLGKHRQYWRDIILGVNDGLISTFLLVAGVSGSGLSSTDILLTAIAGALAGAVSMASGEFIATKSQNEVMKGEIKLERTHIRENKKDELGELTELLQVIGITSANPGLIDQLVAYYDNDNNALLKLMIALEFGVVEDEERSPITAALVSGFLFTLGSLPSVLPFAIENVTAKMGLVCAAVATTLSLFLVGGIKTWATRGNCWNAAAENLIVAGLGGLVAYFVGKFFDGIVH
jgi:VIT1/CCC1 family predicted Fe2+/Mn2+ transporter